MICVISASHSTGTPFTFTVQRERSPKLRTWLMLSDMAGSESRSPQVSQTSCTGRAIWMLFSRRKMRLPPPRPRRPAIRPPPMTAPAPHAKPLQKLLLSMAIGTDLGNRRLPAFVSRRLHVRATRSRAAPLVPSMAAEVRIGTSGWHYRHWVGTFYPAGLPASRIFDYYQRFFDTVELNNSFYRLPTPEAFVAW